ncbi:hypothetical protein [Actinomadura meyerae]|nr:hypothetical protein [Actinomadura meyerae]
MDLQAIEMVTDRLAAEFSIRPPEVTHGEVPRSMRLGVRAKIWGKRLRLVIGSASERLEPDELEGELASAMATFTLRRGYLARSFLSLGAVLACEAVVLALSANAPRWWQDLTVCLSAAAFVAVIIVHYRGLVYRADRKVTEVLGARPLLAVLAAERRIPSNGMAYLWALPDADRRAARITPSTITNG